MSSTNSEPPLWALVDCNNFYASCEKLFRPDLTNKPVVVLSNNDGCIVARSRGAKALGIPMGEPEFRARALLQKHRVAVFSSNYALYGDISARVMSVLESLCPQVEQYSIDEAFLRLSGALRSNALDLAHSVRQIVPCWTGISVSVGVTPTRTLAKLANHLAKEGNGICMLGGPSPALDAVLRAFPVREVWGVGRRQARKLYEVGITSALALRDADDNWLRKKLTVTGWKTALELRGIPCLGQEENPLARRTLVSSRSFGQRVQSLEALEQAVAAFTARAAERLRREDLRAGGLAVHIRTARQGPGELRDLCGQATLPETAAGTSLLLATARRVLHSIFKPGPAYAKAGIMLYNLPPPPPVRPACWLRTRRSRPHGARPSWPRWMPSTAATAKAACASALRGHRKPSGTCAESIAPPAPPRFGTICPQPAAAEGPTPCTCCNTNVQSFTLPVRNPSTIFFERYWTEGRLQFTLLGMDTAKFPHPPQAALQDLQNELRDLKLRAAQDAEKIHSLELQSAAVLRELDQKRQCFSLMAELAQTLNATADVESIFASACRRINNVLGMQRTLLLVADQAGPTFSPMVLHGYDTAQEAQVRQAHVVIEAELLNPQVPVLVTGADSAGRLRPLRAALMLPYLISTPVVINNTVRAILVTGRVVEQQAFFPRLGQADVECVLMVGSYLAGIRAEQRVSEAEERTRIMLDATPLCCNFWDEHYNNLDCNQEAPRLFGLSSKQEYLERFYELSPEFQPCGLRSADKALEKIQMAFSQGYCRFEWMHQKLNGEPVPAEITLVRVRRGSGHIVVGYTRDLREQKTMLAEMRRTEDKLRLALDLAEKNAKAKSEFLANMSHEIRTPMNAVLGMLHLLGNTRLNGQQKDYVSRADHSARLLLRIINDILDFSKIEAGRLEMEHIEFSLSRLLRNVHDIMHDLAKAKGLTLKTGLGAGIPTVVVGDPLRLEQVLLNLVSNAIKFTEQGSIKIRVAALPDAPPGKARLHFEVEDTGIGLTQKQRERLFTPFTQADTSTTRRFGGTGLGLAISLRLVNLMDGQIACESEEGRGSVFSFDVIFTLAASSAGEAVLPAGDVPAEDAPDPTDEDFSALHGLHVLLAEDNELNQIIATELLAAKGVHTTTVYTGREALQALEKQDFDLVLMDIQMPEMDGLTATTLLRAMPRYQSLPIIAMTAHAMVGDRELSLNSGMNDHLTKPIDPHALYTTLLRWTRKA